MVTASLSFITDYLLIRVRLHSAEMMSSAVVVGVVAKVALSVNPLKNLKSFNFSVAP